MSVLMLFVILKSANSLMSTFMFLSSDPFRAAIPGETDLNSCCCCEEDPDPAGFGVRIGRPPYDAAAADVTSRF